MIVETRAISEMLNVPPGKSETITSASASLKTWNPDLLGIGQVSVLVDTDDHIEIMAEKRKIARQELDALLVPLHLATASTVTA
jgi:hypothetical protein